MDRITMELNLQGEGGERVVKAMKKRQSSPYEKEKDIHKTVGSYG